MTNLSGVLPTNFNPKDYIKQREYNTGGDPRQAFANEMRNLGFKVPNVVAVSDLQRLPDSEDKGAKKSAWYIYHEIEDDQRSGYMIGVGIFGTWRDEDTKHKYCSKQLHSMSIAERQRYDQQIKDLQLKYEQEKRQRQQAAKEQAVSIWGDSKTEINHPYITNKKIQAMNVRQKDETLLVPIYDDGELCNLQRINKDGGKFFLSGGKVKGCYSLLSGSNDVVYIAEGYSTAASVHEATGATVYIAFNAGNLYEVSALVNSKHHGTRIIIAADNDADNNINVGREKAEQAAEGLGLEYVLPKHGTDFNDLHFDYGIEAVREQLSFKPEVYKEEEKESAFLKPPPGILSDIAGYYNATSGNDQKGFAIQTALAVCSVVCGRVFRTNKSNFTSMYFLNVAKSSTGKEHSKSVIEEILEAAGVGYLVSGDGYTSAGGVFSALLDKPRHITIIDEFGRYIESASKSNSTNQKEANSQLMQALTRNKGIMRPPVYSSMTAGANKEVNKDRKILNPALTIMSMTTPCTMFGAIDIRQVNDGFLNRFIVSISDTERDVRRHKDDLAVPTRIIEWINQIEARRGGQTESALESPEFIVLDFTDEAMAASDKFQEYTNKELPNELDAMGLSVISGRTNEMAMRMSLVCALARDPDAETVELGDMEWAISYARNCLDRLVDHIKMSVSSSPFEAHKKEVLAAMRILGDKGASWKMMNKRAPFAQHQRKYLKEILDALVEADLAHIEELKPDGRGRPTILYKASK